MITGDKYINLALKRFVSHNRLKDNFLDYLLDGQREHVSRIFPTQGLFTYPATLTYPGTSGVGYMDFSPDPIIGSDGEGHIISAAGNAVLLDVPFPNTAGKDYWFALHYAEKPSGMYLNPRTGLPEYDTWEEALGRSAAPTSAIEIVPGSGNIQFNVDSICASGVDYSGMTVTVWLNNPQDSDESIAIETLTVTYSAPNNIITMTSGTGLGQASISTTNTDYTVCLNGIVWQEVATGAGGAGNPFTSDYTILGYRNVNTNTEYDSAVENDIAGGGGHSLQNAYTYTGSGAGRTIQANYQAVEITQENTTFREDDIIQAGLRITKDNNTLGYDGTIKDYEVGLDITGRSQMYGAVLHRALIIDEAGAGELQADEPITFLLGGNQITGTRAPGGVDFNLGSATYQTIIPNYDLIEISGSTSDDGVYIVSSVDSGTQITLKNLDFTAISFNAADGGAAVASVYRPIAKLGGTNHASPPGDRMSSGLQIITLSDVYSEYAAGSPQTGGGISIYVPPNTPNTTQIIRSYKITGGETFYVAANGDVNTDGDISTNGTGTISSATTVTGVTGVTAITGNVTAIVGAVSAGTTVTGGTGVTATTGNVTASAGAVSANTTVTAGTGITSTTGDIVCTAGDIKVTNAAKNFIYGSARTFYRSYNPSDFIVNSTHATLIDTTDLSVTPYININNATTPLNWAAALPLNNLPNGATITEIEAMVNEGTGIHLRMYGRYESFTWGVAAVSSAYLFNAPNYVETSAGALEVIKATTPGLAYTVVDNSDTTITLYFNLENAAGTYNQKIYGVRVTYTMLNVIP